MSARKLPENAVELLDGRGFAAEIVENCTVAYWMMGRDDDTALYHLNAMHKRFAQLADALGYDIAARPAKPAAQEVAA